jgi:hypothetical protein
LLLQNSFIIQMTRPASGQGRGNRGRGRGWGRGGKVGGKWKIKDCYQCNLWIDNEALGSNEVLALLDKKTATD